MIDNEQTRKLVGKGVELVCFAQYSLYIHLESKISITVESTFEYGQAGSDERHAFEFPLADSSLMRVLGCTIVSAAVMENRGLLLNFSNGDNMSVNKDPAYECYRLKIGGEEFFP